MNNIPLLISLIWIYFQARLMWSVLPKENKLLAWFQGMSRCPKCLSFFVVLIFTHDIIAASFVSMGAAIIDKHTS